VAEPREHVEALGLAGDGFRNDPSGKTGQGDTVTRESLETVSGDSRPKCGRRIGATLAQPKLRRIGRRLASDCEVCRPR
jgi:hypothetical protein